MRYSGIECVRCGRVFEESDDVVVCPVCGAPHHRECWLADNACACAGQHGEGFEWKFPEGKDPAEILRKEAEERKRPKAPEFEFKNGEGVVLCPKCGSVNYENDAFCLRCHSPLNGNETASQIPYEPSGEAPADDAYRPDPARLAMENQRYYGGLAPNILVGGIPAAELSDYIGGKNPGRMIRKYASAERYGNKLTFNLSAALFGPIYCFFRRMNKLGAIALALAFVLNLASVLLMMTPAYLDYSEKLFDLSASASRGEITLAQLQEKTAELTEEYAAADRSTAETLREGFAAVLSYGNYAVHLLCGLFFDKYYRKKIASDVESARRENNNMTDYRYALKRKGGTSAAGAVLGVILYTAALFLSELPVVFAVFMK